MTDKKAGIIRLRLFIWLIILIPAIWGLTRLGYYVYTEYILSPEQKIECSINTIRQAAEDKSVKAIMEQVSNHYSDRISKNKKELADKVRYWCFKNLQEEVKIEVQQFNIKLAENKQSAEVTLKATGNKPFMDVYKYLSSDDKIKVLYIFENDTWLIKGYKRLK